MALFRAAIVRPLSVIAAVLSVLAVSGTSSIGAAATGPQLVSTVAALQALGSGSVQVGTAYVLNYQFANDGGGGMFVWNPSSNAATNRCITFSANGVTTGRWVRLLNGTPFNADMCGTGTSDDSTAINAAFQVCATQSMALYFPAKNYYLLNTLTASPACSFFGAGNGSGNGTNNAIATTFNFVNAPASVTQLMNIVGARGFGMYDWASPFGNFRILDGDKIPRRGLYISRVGNVIASNITVWGVLGTGIFLGQQQQSSYHNLYVTLSGSPTAALLDIDGESNNGIDYESTTTSLYDTRVEIDNGKGALCGIAINRNETLSLFSGDSEANGTPVCIGNKPATTMPNGPILIQNFDMENPGNGQTACITIGGGWKGTPLQGGNKMVRLIGATCTPSSVPGAAAFTITQSDGFYAAGNDVEFLITGQKYFDFEGPNTNASLGANGVGNSGPVGTYVTVNGVADTDGVEYNPWSMNNSYAGTVLQQYGTLTVAALPACNAGALGSHAYVTDSTQTTFFAVAAGGGSNTVPVGCDGTNWRIGG